MTWYVVAARRDADPLDQVWTLTQDPKVTGWCTDGGYHGYGLTKQEAECLADAANATGFTCPWNERERSENVQ